MVRATAALVALVIAAAAAEGQTTRRPAARRTQPPLTTVDADVTCPALLGVGVKTRRTYCDVLTGREPAEGIIVKVPPRTGPATLLFDLHNRQTYSEEQVSAGKGFARYTATIGVLTPKKELLTRATILSEFRTAGDLVDRIGGGAGPGGVKAVAPTGTESIVVTIPAGVTEVSLLGERLELVRADGQEVFVAPGRPIAVVSNVRIEYRPAPARR
jgi:hypothetical protein